jgi:glyoxylase-like metal-dependent hydrolase (beta-lactamase superfamily II)
MLLRRSMLGLLGLAFTTAACGSAPPSNATSQTKLRGKAQRLEVDPRVGVYTSIPWGFDTASYWIEGPDGLIVIDTQFLPSASAEVIEAAESITGKKIKLAIVLHPNPDKFNGTATFQARGIKVVTSAQVLEKIPEVHDIRLLAFYDRYKPDYPEDLPKPESFGDKDQEISAGGVTVKAHLMGAGCSAAHVVIEYEGHVFVGDLVGNGTHAWLEIGEPEAWIERMAEIKALSPRFVHPGRGKTGGPELLDWEAGYLRRVLEEVAKEKPVIPAPKGAIERIQDRIMKAYPELGYDVFLELGLPQVWRKQAEKEAGGSTR